MHPVLRLVVAAAFAVSQFAVPAMARSASKFECSKAGGCSLTCYVPAGVDKGTLAVRVADDVQVIELYSAAGSLVVVARDRNRKVVATVVSTDHLCVLN